jgi:hypothetical protein
VVLRTIPACAVSLHDVGCRCHAAAVVIACLKGRAGPLEQEPIKQEGQPEPAPQRPLEITVPDVPEAKEWLDNYFHRKEQQQQQQQAQAQQQEQPPEQQQASQQSQRPSWLQQTMKSLTTVCGVPMGQPEVAKRHLLLATVGDQWNTSRCAGWVGGGTGHDLSCRPVQLALKAPVREAAARPTMVSCGCCTTD